MSTGGALIGVRIEAPSSLFHGKNGVTNENERKMQR